MSDIMKNFDKRTQMMDGGIVLFGSGKDFGTALGQVRAELLQYGRVFRKEDVAGMVPDSAGEFDFFLDYSTIWRKRYISARVESSSGGYAVSFKEGNRSTGFRGFVMATCLIASLLSIFIISFPVNVAGIVLCVCIALEWMSPGASGWKNVRELKRALAGKDSDI